METEPTTTTEEEEECGACHRMFPTLNEVFSHDCPAITTKWRPLIGTNRGDNVDAPEQSDGTGRGGNTESRSNRHPGRCIDCGHWVEAEAGILLKDHAGGSGGGATVWAVKHRPGDCSTEPAPPAPNPEQGPVNKYPGDCRHCGTRIEAGAGHRLKQNGRWLVEHPTGQCPVAEPAEAPAEHGSPAPTTEVEITPGFWMHPDTGRVAEVVLSKAGRLYAKLLDPDTGHFEYDRGLIREILGGGWVPLTKEAAAELGRRFGRCMICGRLLTNEDSISAGIGPICAGRL